MELLARTVRGGRGRREEEKEEKEAGEGDGGYVASTFAALHRLLKDYDGHRERAKQVAPPPQLPSRCVASSTPFAAHFRVARVCQQRLTSGGSSAAASLLPSLLSSPPPSSFDLPSSSPMRPVSWLASLQPIAATAFSPFHTPPLTGLFARCDYRPRPWPPRASGKSPHPSARSAYRNRQSAPQPVPTAPSTNLPFHVRSYRPQTRDCRSPPSRSPPPHPP